jgi:hypothetical protein
VDVSGLQRAFAGGRTILMRTVKSCGPGIPVLMPSATRQRCRDTGATKPVPGESAKQLLKPSRGEGRMFGSYLW